MWTSVRMFGSPINKVSELSVVGYFYKLTKLFVRFKAERVLQYMSGSNNMWRSVWQFISPTTKVSEFFSSGGFQKNFSNYL